MYQLALIQNLKSVCICPYTQAYMPTSGNSDLGQKREPIM